MNCFEYELQCSVLTWHFVADVTVQLPNHFYVLNPVSFFCYFDSILEHVFGIAALAGFTKSTTPSSLKAIWHKMFLLKSSCSF